MSKPMFRVVIVKNFIQRNKEVLLKFESKVLSTFGLDFTGDAMRLAEIFSVLMGLKRKKTEHFGHQIVQNSTKCATIKTQSIGNDWVKKSKGVDTMAYTAMQIAAEVVRQYHEKGKSITNLKLQKVLYYIQVKCLQKNGVPAFEDNIEAWRHGPVVRDVYNAFCAYIANPISDDDPDVTKNQVKIDDATSQCIADIVDRTIPYDPWELVDKSHESAPWRSAFIPYANCIISKDSLKNNGFINL